MTTIVDWRHGTSWLDTLDTSLQSNSRPMDSIIATAGEDGTVRLWRREQKTLIREFARTPARATDVARSIVPPVLSRRRLII